MAVTSDGVDNNEIGRIARGLEPLHAMAYFAPETEREMTGIGLEPGWMGYFAGRAAPMGAVSASVVTATFYNFSPKMVGKHIPAAWSRATPQAVIGARFAAVDAALRRMLGSEVLASAELAEAAKLARAAAESCSVEGRPLAAGHLGQEWPTEPHLVLWHALSVLREHRGDGHIAVLIDAGLSGLQALVSHTATGKGFTVAFAQASRGWTQAEWDEAVEQLRSRGVLDDTGELTEQGKRLRAQLEEDTNRLGSGPWRALGAEGATRLAELGAPLVRSLLTAGCFPAKGVFAQSRS